MKIQDFINKDDIFICICELEPSVSGGSRHSCYCGICLCKEMIDADGKGTTECQTCALGRNVIVGRTHNLASSQTLREVNL